MLPCIRLTVGDTGDTVLIPANRIMRIQADEDGDLVFLEGEKLGLVVRETPEVVATSYNSCIEWKETRSLAMAAAMNKQAATGPTLLVPLANVL